MKKRLKDKLKKKLRQKVDRKYIGFHVYRSVNENLPFVFWERLTDDPVPDFVELYNAGNATVDLSGCVAAVICRTVTWTRAK